MQEKFNKIFNSIISEEKLNQINILLSNLDLPSNDIYNFLIINHNNLLNIKQKNFNISSNSEFYANINNKKINNLIGKIIGMIYNLYEFTDHSNFNNYDLDKINNLLLLNGIYIHNEFIKEEICENIINKINNKYSFQNISNNKILDNINLYNTSSGTTWIKNHKDIISISEVQQIATDPFILNVAQNYLQCKPILIQTNFWVSCAGSNDQTNFFHQDYDDVNFLKVFIYLNDIDDDNGPHSYVKGCLNNMITPIDYKPSKRLDDDYINEKYGENVIKITGKKGTIIFEDTNGFHKGNILNKGYRFMLQLQYGSSTKFLDNKINFINDLTEEELPKLYEEKNKYPDTYFIYNFI